MPNRLIELLVPASMSDEAATLLDRDCIAAKWRVAEAGGHVVFKAIMPAGGVDELIDDLENRFEDVETVRLVLYPLEATWPRVLDPEDKKEREKEKQKNGEAPDEPEAVDPETGEPAEQSKPVPQRISRAELYEDLGRGARINTLYLVQVALATIVAAAGLLRDQPAVVIGAMVIAPLLGPSVALALGTTLGDLGLIKRAVKANGVGVALAVAMSAAMGLLIDVDPSVGELASRSSVGMGDVVLALASGVMGALAFSAGLASSLVGVMVAIALLPPTVAAGVLLGSGNFAAGAQASLLLAVNLVCLNLAAMITFRVQGIRPKRWWEAERSKRATRIAAAVWGVLLLVLVALIVVLGGVLTDG